MTEIGLSDANRTPIARETRWPRAVAACDAEHGADDDVERYGLRDVLHREALADGDVLRAQERGVAHDGAVRAHARAVERRRQQLARAPVRRPALQEERVLAQE